MLDAKIVICGAVRNCEKYLNGLFDNFNTIVPLFKEVKFVFSESDSSDNTIDAIKTLLDNNKFEGTIYSFGNLENQFKQRTDRIAIARNQYINHVKEKLSNYDFMLVVDMDDVNSNFKLKPEAILSNFNYTGWDMITANQPSAYYDLWALRHDEWMPFDCWEKFINRPQFMSETDAHRIYVGSRFIQINENLNPIKVKSAFGGMGFIKISSLKDAYHVGNINGKSICEWVPFCEKLNDGNANIYINPKFINTPDVCTHVQKV